ncbi:MAG: T9SS type A sorting domain-containing protein [Flavobacteriales bacterium]|nr:T9SS type A sorting domain-containing protein [Flavobacteriales bacterium]
MVLEYQDIPAMDGPIMYAVEAVYQEGVSEPSFSNMVDFNVGVEEIDNVIGLSIYPNPSEGRTTIELDLQSEESISIRIRNSLGQIVHQLPQRYSAQYRESLDLNYLDTGLYLIEMTIGHEQHTEKLSIHK